MTTLLVLAALALGFFAGCSVGVGWVLERAHRNSRVLRVRGQRYYLFHEERVLSIQASLDKAQAAVAELHRRKEAQDAAARYDPARHGPME